MCPASQAFTEVVGEAANVCAGRTRHPKGQARRLQPNNMEFVNFYTGRRIFDYPTTASELVRGNSSDFLCRKWRGDLIDHSGQTLDCRLDIFLRVGHRQYGTRGGAFSIVRSRRKTEVDLARIYLGREIEKWP